MKKMICFFLSGLFFLNACAQKEKLPNTRVQQEKRLLIPFTLHEKVGFIDQHMKLVYPAQFIRILDLSDEFAFVQEDVGKTAEEKDWRYFFIDSHGKHQEIDSSYDFGFLPNDLYYLYANDGYERVYNPKLDMGIPRGATMVFHLYGKEKKLLPHVQLFTSDTPDYINAVITDRKSPHAYKKTYVNIDGEPSFPNIYRSVCGYFSKDEEAAFISSETWRGDFRILTKAGEIREKYLFDYAEYFSSGLAFCVRQGDGAIGFFDTHGELKIPIKVLPGTQQDDRINYHFENGIAPAVLIDGNLYAVFYSQRYPSKNWCLINTEGKAVKSGIEASYISNFLNGVSEVCNKENKYALMKNDGTFITDFVFDALESNHYYVEGKTEGKDVLIDRENGKIYYCEDFK